ncbi:MAG: InlB B-repeat-containing protein [Defluviitaleaceae bacterium]|nr:InlB B-repeat-containing protein [Defluviitaleaceae bacterium]
MKKILAVSLSLIVIAYLIPTIVFADGYEISQDDHVIWEVEDYIPIKEGPDIAYPYLNDDGNTQKEETEAPDKDLPYETAPMYETIIPSTHVSVSTWDELATAINDGAAHIEILTDFAAPAGSAAISITEPITIASTNGHTITQPNADQRHFEVHFGGVLELDNVALTGDNIGGGISVRGGTLIMNSGIISGNYAPAGGAVDVSDGIFNMYDGIISGNTSSTGGGIFITQSNFEMHGGEISGNTAFDHGGGMYLVHTTFNMWGGKISNNIVPSGQFGGGILLDADAIMHIHDGEISDNYAPFGGGIATHGGQLTMYAGRIMDNTAVLGGGIYDEFYSSHPFLSTLYSGAISGNTAEFGGAICIETDAFLTVIDVIISDNTADQGGGIYLSHDAALNVTGTSAITQNSAQGGGGIFISDPAYANVNLSNTTIFDANDALQAYFPPTDALTDFPDIGFARTSIAWPDGTYLHPLNNYDINFIGTPITVYSVIYNANSGTGTYSVSTMATANHIVLDISATGISHPDYNFTGWNTEADGSGTAYIPDDVIAMDSDITLFAQWEPTADNRNIDDNTPSSDGGFDFGGNFGGGSGGSIRRPSRPSGRPGNTNNFHDGTTSQDYVQNHFSNLPYHTPDLAHSYTFESENYMQQNNYATPEAPIQAHDLPLNEGIYGNPQTSDNSNFTGLIISAFGLVISLTTLLYNIKRRRKAAIYKA